jgi:thiamine-monophosphate kinase
VKREESLGPGLEFDLIRRFLERSAAPGPEVVLGPGDDCALIASPRIAISVDLSMEGVHFRREWLAPEELGYRATAAALSDLAAMAAEPIGVLASLAVPQADLPDFAVRIMAGVREAVEGCGGTLIGGDLVRSTGQIVLDIVALGGAESPILRSGAEPGDTVWVSGELGAAAAAVVAWTGGGEPDPEARRAFARPEPRIAEARWLASQGALHALLDISDGIAGDLRHIAAASGVGLVIDETMIPVHPAAARTSEGLRLALSGGEDYELCFTAPAGRVERIVTEFADKFGVALHRIGEVVEGEEVWLRRADGTVEQLLSSGFEHFHGSSDQP